MKYYNYEDLGIVSPKKTFNAHLWWVISSTLWYMVDSTNQKVLLKSVDKGANWTTATTRDHKIQSGFPDGTYIWLVDCDNDGTADDFDVWTITIDGNDTIDSIGTGVTTTANECYVYDIFICNNNTYVILTDTIFRTEIWDVDTAPFSEIDDIPSSDNEGLKLSFAVVIGTDAYFLHYWWTVTNTSYQARIIKFTGTTTTLSYQSGGHLNGYWATIRNLQGISYDGSDVFYFVIKRFSDSKNYLVAFSITDDAFTVLGEQDVALMLDRNTASGVMEKAFHLTEPRVYQLHPYASHQLYYIANLGTGNVIIAITDNFLMLDGGEMYEYVDFIGSIFTGFISHSRNDFPKLQMKFNSDNITIKPQQFVQIIGPYTANDSNRIFKGTYNFKDDTIGSVPLGWTNDSAAVIYNAWQAHSHVLELTRDGSNPVIEQEFGSNEESGTVEFYMGSDDVTYLSHFRLFDGASQAIYIAFREEWLTHYIAGYNNICGVSDDVIYHIRIDFECNAGGYEGLAADTYYIYVNETRYGPYNFKNVVPHIDKIVLTCNTAQVYHAYFDSFGYSWDTNYNIGDNRDVEEGEPNQVVFEGIAKKPTKGRIQYVLIENQGSEMDYVQPKGSKSGRTDEIIVDINNDGAPHGPEYIRGGTLSVGGAMGTLILGGAKDYREVVDDFAEHDAFLWNLRTQGQLDYNDGSIDSGADIRFDGSTYTDTILQLKAWTISKLNQIIVNGAINTATGELYTGKWDDEEDQQENGINSITIEDAQLNSDALCQSKADTIGGNEVEKIRAQFKFRKTAYGLIQPGQTITFKYDVANYITITEAQYMVDKIIINFKSEVGYMEISSSL